MKRGRSLAWVVGGLAAVAALGSWLFTTLASDVRAVNHPEPAYRHLARMREAASGAFGRSVVVERVFYVDADLPGMAAAVSVRPPWRDQVRSGALASGLKVLEEGGILLAEGKGEAFAFEETEEGLRCWWSSSVAGIGRLRSEERERP
jgi:hypothetical protein